MGLITEAFTAAHHARHAARSSLEWVAKRAAPNFLARRVSPLLTEGLNRHQKLFIHIPKAGGTSIATVLYGRGFGHNTWRDFRRLLPREVWDASFRFAVVRDPVERFQSAYYALRAADPIRHQPIWRFAERHVFPHKNIDEFAAALSMKSRLRGAILSWVFFRPQTDFVTTLAGRLVAHRLIPLEQLSSETATAIVGDAVPHLNATDYRVRERLSDPMQDYVRHLYKDDCALHRFAILNHGMPVIGHQYRSDDRVRPIDAGMIPLDRRQ